MNSLQRFNLLIGALWGQAETAYMMSDEVAEDSGGSPLILGVDRKGRRLILTPVDDSFAFAPQRGASLELTEWRHPNTDQRHLVVRSSSDGLAEVFGAFTDNVIQRVQSGTTSIDAILAALNEWRTLFKPAYEVSKNVARGLFGELWVLTQIAKINPNVALERWIGPEEDAPHDFMSASRHLEVKTTEQEGMSVLVSSLAQLDTVGGTPLALMRIRVRSQPEGKNIGDMLDDLTALGCHRPDLLQKVSKAGFISGADPDKNHFSVVDDPVVWAVTEGFPGLRSKDIPKERRDAISGVKYSLDLLSAPGRVETLDGLDALMKELVDR